ncbi:DUF2971 domain-containing protein [Plantibacter sp. MMLR14_011]|uniref:DUF2971 domain-containing protein n=1 Tax=Plantibacter sp. MMLR14_011 TaxID=1898746 RepID=UPI0008DC9560|nr:DUF2971 domain-containing protein [Plantibacter sp. MMLR14_011]OII39303.1 hypothetical protein BIU99_07940 [Plantibacter sp. MMLR14_011]
MPSGLTTPDQHEPPLLYHYTNAGGLQGIIGNRELWATESNYLNDPSEISFASVELLRILEEMKRAGTEHPDRAEHAIELLKRAYVDPNSASQYQEDRAFITSFSRSDQSLTLWRLYSGRNGFSIGFDENVLQAWIGAPTPADFPQEFEATDQERLRAYNMNFHIETRVEEVSYDSARIQEVAEIIMTTPLVVGEPFADEARLRLTLRAVAGVKHHAFADEKEARLIVQAVGDFAADPSVRVAADGSLVAYRKVAIPFEAVRSITIAPAANVQRTEHALQSLMRTGGRGAWSHVEVRSFDVPFAW